MDVSKTFRWWADGFLLGFVVSLASAGPAGAAEAPLGVQVWNADPVQVVGEKGGGPGGPLGPMRLMAPRNGVSSGQVVVSAPAPLANLSAEVTDLRSPAGGKIPSRAIQVRYAKLGRPFVPLLEEPVAGAKVQPVWLTVKVPPDAAPGTYRGTLSTSGIGKTVRVPVELTVFGWKVGAPNDWKTWVNLLQSPESVAGYYKVRMWSEAHFRLMEKSIALMGPLGNDILGISAVGKTVFGDDPLIVFRREGSGPLGYVPEFRFLERYLKLYDRHCGEPRMLSVHVWSYGMYQRGGGRDGGRVEKRSETIPIVELRGDALVPVDFPIFGRPGTEAVWRRVMDGLRERVGRLGWRKVSILLGTSGDTWPSVATVRFFKKIAPYARWRVLTHGSGCPQWGPTPLERTQPNEMIVGYLEIARRLVNRRDKLPDHPVCCNSRDKVGSAPFTYRALLAVTSVKVNYDGICWKGIDYWTYTRPDGTTRNALNTYVHFGNMVGSTPRAMAAPGPDGAVVTVQIEMLREGIQECEAMLSIRENLKVLYPQPMQTFDVVQLRLKGALVREDGAENRGKDLDLSLYFRDGRLRSEVLPKATTYNTGEHEGRAEAIGCDDGQKFGVEVTIGDDRWVKGAKGRYVIHVKRTGDAYAGSYTGSFSGHQRGGAVIGTFAPRGFRMPLGRRPEDGRSRRCESAVKDLLDRLEGKDAGGRDEYWRRVARVYRAATELAKAVEEER